MNKEFIDAFYQLNINSKRDKVSRELLAIGDYIKKIEDSLGLDNTIDIYNYNPNTDRVMDESDHLTSLYQDIFNIQRELITIEHLIGDSYENNN